MKKILITALAVGAVTYITLAASGQKKLKVGDKAPDFTLVDERGNTVHLADISGDVALAFFPSAQSVSVGCKKQMCSVRDEFAQLKEHGIKMFGLCDSSQKTLAAFAREHRLPFPLLHAPKSVTKAYGVHHMWGAARYTFLVRNGVIVAIITKVDLKHHAEQIVAGFKAVQ